jgi:hypothetical protein
MTGWAQRMRGWLVAAGAGAACLAAAVPAASGASPRSLPRCRFTQLRISLAATPGGLGHDGVVIRFRDVGPRCVLGGYPGVDGLSAAGTRAVSAQRSRSGYLGGLRRLHGPLPTVTLGAGRTASALVEWISAPCSDTHPCPQVHSLEVTPPGATRSARRRLTRGRPVAITDVEVHPVVPGRSGEDPVAR